MIVFENNKYVVYDKITNIDITELADHLQHGREVFDKHSNLRFSVFRNILQIADLKNASPVGNPKIQLIEAVIKYNIRMTVKDIFEPILDWGSNLNWLFDADFLKDLSSKIDTNLDKYEDTLGDAIFNPMKKEFFDFPELFKSNLDKKVLAYYIINSESLTVIRYDKKGKDFAGTLSNSETIEFAEKLFYTKTINYDSRINKIRKEGFEITINLSDDEQFTYRIIHKDSIHNESLEIDGIIMAIKNNEMKVENLPDKYLTPRVITEIIKISPYNVENISPIRLTAEDYKLAVSIDGAVLALIPEAWRTLDICKIAIENEPYAESFVPESLKRLLITT